MTDKTFVVLEATPGSDVATSGTITFAYPGSTGAADYVTGDAKLYSQALESLFKEADGDISISLGGSNITVTYSGSTTIPGGTQVRLELSTDAYAKLTDNTGGTAADALAAVSGSGDDATINNNLASVNAKLNEIFDLLDERGFYRT